LLVGFAGFPAAVTGHDGTGCGLVLEETGVAYTIEQDCSPASSAAQASSHSVQSLPKQPSVPEREKMKKDQARAVRIIASSLDEAILRGAGTRRSGPAHGPRPHDRATHPRRAHATACLPAPYTPRSPRLLSPRCYCSAPHGDSTRGHTGTHRERDTETVTGIPDAPPGPKE
jgi:hypothetical protein